CSTFPYPSSLNLLRRNLQKYIYICNGALHEVARFEYLTFGHGSNPSQVDRVILGPVRVRLFVAMRCSVSVFGAEWILSSEAIWANASGLSSARMPSSDPRKRAISSSTYVA